MINTTVKRLKCPKRKKGKLPCGGSLQLLSKQSIKANSSPEVFEVRTGSLKCQLCQAEFPILAGVALLVEDVRIYLLTHVKGIAQVVSDSEIPRSYLKEFLEAKAEIQNEHIEEDLEAQRVNALYLMNHYLRVKNTSQNEKPWWKPQKGEGSPLIESLIQDYWDRGPFSKIEEWTKDLLRERAVQDALELGCGVGGLYSALKGGLGSYLGVDSSFASIAWARHLNLGVPHRSSILIPGDLLQGSVSRKVQFPHAESFDGSADFIVGDVENIPLREAQWDLVLALNAIDMLDVPSALPKLKKNLLKERGIAIQSCPYVWHERVAKKLRSLLPKEIQDSAKAVEWLYEKEGFKIEKAVSHLPWLFFKHLRQIEIYSVHLFLAKK
jgi:SAM-dependent methyltransferase